MTTRLYTSTSQQTTLTAALNSTATTMVVNSANGLLAGSIQPTGSQTFTVVIDPDTSLEEVVDVVYPSAPGNATITIVRGQAGTSAVAHSAGAAVRHMGTGRDFTEANQHIENTTSVHGLTIANVVETTDTSVVSSGMLIDGAVGTAKIDDTAVTTAKLAPNAVTTAKITDLNVTTGKIADLAITTGKIADSAVTSAKIADLTIATGDIADGAITSAKIADLTIATGDIADSAITSAKIADGTIVNADINAAAAIDKTKISGTAITAGDTGTVTSTMIADGTIVNADINTSAQIAYGKLNLTNSVVNADISASAAIALSKLATDPLARANHTGTQTASTISDFNTAVRTNRLDQMATPTTDVSMGTYKITNLGTPVSNTDASTKAYVDTSIANLIAGAPSTLDTLDEIAAALADTANFSDTVVLKTGSTMSGALNMGTNKITNMGTPTVSTDAATKGYVDTVTVAPSNLTGPITSVGSATAVASQTGTGSTFVMNTSPTLVTPNIGVATATSINGTTIPSSKTLVATDSTQYVVPSQTGNSGKFLTTNGTTSSWASTVVPADYTAKGVILVGTAAGTYTAQTVGTNGQFLQADSTQADGVKWATVDALPSQTGNSGKYLTTDGTTASWATVVTDPTADIFMMMGA